MVRTISLALAASFTLAGCAVENIPYPRPEAGPYPATPAPSRPDVFINAPHASTHSELFACHGGGGSNIGQIGYHGEVVLFSPYIDTPAGSLLRMPVETACLSSGFGWRGAAEGGGRQHNGVDLANAEGGWIFAAAAGRIARADYLGGYGNTVEIDHGNGVHTLYAHLSEIDPSLRPGSRVEAGQAIARMGMTGNATGVHLHYEVWVDGLLVDPLNYGRPPVYVSAPLRQPIPLPSEPAAQRPEDKPIVETPSEPIGARGAAPDGQNSWRRDEQRDGRSDGQNDGQSDGDGEAIVWPDDEAPDNPAR